VIKLLNLINLAGVKLGKFKIHCAVVNPSGDSPLQAFYDGKFQRWQEYQGKQNFQCEKVLSLIKMERDQWLFAGVFNVNGVKPRTDKLNGYIYSTSEVGGLDSLVGRAIVTFNKKFRASYLKGHKYGDSLTISEIKPERVSIGDFPGYNAVQLPLPMLRTIVRQSLASWKTALSNVAGVYLIADNADKVGGKLCVGSAYGSKGLWQRWCNYASTGDGGDKELQEVLAKHGVDYARNFQFTILEVIDLNASLEYVQLRESHWKKVLLTRRFGYNSN